MNIRTAFNKKLGPLTVGQLLFWGVVLVLAVGGFSFIRDLVTCWTITALPGTPPSNCGTVTAGLNGPVINEEGTPVAAAATSVVAPPPEISIPSSDIPPAWDGASRITVLLIGLDYRDWVAGEGAPRSDSMILLTIPIFYPMVMGLDFFGLSPTDKSIWFGILALMVVEIGLVHPPVGMNVYVINRLARDVPLTETFKGVMPFLLSDFIRIIALLFFPALSLGPVQIHWYGLTYLVAFGLFLWLAGRRVQHDAVTHALAFGIQGLLHA